MIKPTNGRIVWIHDHQHTQPLAAIITWVHADNLINVCAFWPNGQPRPMEEVMLMQDTADSNINVMRPYAAWMPYQKAVAAGEIAPTLHAAPK